MKRWLVLILLFNTLMVPLNIEGRKINKSSVDPIDLGITEPRAKVNATYARGDTWSVKYEDGIYNWRSESMWIWNGSRYVPYIFEDKGAYYVVRSGLIGAEIHRGKAVFYSPDLERLAVGRENWIVYQWIDMEWIPVCASLQKYFDSVTTQLQRDNINVIVEWSTPKGNLTIKYLFREKLKHNVEWTPSQDGRYAIVQFWNETQYDKVFLTNGTILRRSEDKLIGKSDSLTFLFHDDAQPFGILEDQSSAIHLLHKVIFAKGKVNYQGISISNGVAYIFYNNDYFDILSGQTIHIDPYTSTLNNPSEDGHVYQWGGGPSYKQETDLTYIRDGYDDDYGRIYRSYVEWNISSIKDTVTITDTDFIYHGKKDDASWTSGVFAMEFQPTNVSAETIWGDAGNGTQYVSYGGLFIDLGSNKTQDLGASADSDLQSQLSSDWFAIGMRTESETSTANHWEEIYAEEYGTANPKPTLSITYTGIDIYAVDATTAFSAGSYGWVNATVVDYSEVANLDTVTITANNSIPQNFTLRWNQTTGAFSEISDPDSICDMSGSVRENIDDYMDKIAFRFKLVPPVNETAFDVEVVLINDDALNETEVYQELFTYVGIEWDPIGDLIDSAFSLFGISAYMAQAINFVSEISAHFTGSLSGLVIMINLQFQIIWKLFSRVTDWFTRIVNGVITFGTTMHDITTGIATGTVNLWEYFNFSNIIDAIPLFVIIFWIDTVYKRGNTQGYTQVLWNDAQAMINVSAFFMGTFATVIGYIEGKISWLFQALT